MGKWGVFSALSYLGTDRGAGRRTVRADGRPLHRPLRNWSDDVQDEARRRRKARRQPWWPRFLGWMFLSMALIAAVRAEYPMPRPAQAAISVGAASCLVAIEPVSPAGPHEGVPADFRWTTDAPPPYTLVVLDAAYREVARVEGLGERSVRPDSVLAQRLGSGGAFHWYVQTSGPAGPSRSPVAAFEIR